MPLVKSAPVHLEVFDNNGRFTIPWTLWFESVDRRLAEVADGGATGDVMGDTNTGFSIEATGDIYINNMKFNPPDAEGQVAIVSGGELGWAYPDDLAAVPTGTIRPKVAGNVPSGWVELSDGTIGSASSGASTRANADTEDLYTLIWNGVSNTYAPVSGGRGVSAAADFAANKTIQTGYFAGRALRIMAGTGSLGETFGNEEVVMSQNQLPEHRHELETCYSGAGSVSGAQSHQYESVLSGDDSKPGWNGKWNTIAGYSDYNNESSGGDQAQSVMQPTVFLEYMIKL